MKNLIRLIITIQIAFIPYFIFSQVTLNIFMESNQILPMDGIDVVFKIKNEGKDTLKINTPNTYQETIEIILTRNGQSVYKSVVWDGPNNASTIVLPPNSEYEYEFDITTLYPFLYESGNYVITAIYNSNERGNKINSENSISFFMKPLSIQEEEARQSFMKLQHTGTLAADVKYGFKFLEKHPNSIYSSAVKRRTASSLSRLKRYDEAIDLFKSALNTESLSKRMKIELTSSLSWTYYKKGDLENAIALMKTQKDTPTKIMLLKKWNREMEERKD